MKPTEPAQTAFAQRSKRIGRTLGILILAVIVLLVLNPFVIIGAGERGVVLNFGAVQDEVMDEGLHLRIPLMQKVVKIDV